MKTIITSTGNSVESKFDKRFGKASWFCLYNEASGDSIFIKNSVNDTEHGACKRAADLLKELEASKVISGHFGPNAGARLKKSDIQMVILEDKNLTIQDIIGKIK